MFTFTILLYVTLVRTRSKIDKNVDKGERTKGMPIINVHLCAMCVVNLIIKRGTLDNL